MLTYILARVHPDYLTDETEFLKRVEEDAVSFKPLGQLLYTYTRPLPHILQKGKGKSVANGNGSQSGDVVTYEVYHVSICLLLNTRFASIVQNTLFLIPLYSPSRHGTPLVSENTTAGCNCSFCSILKEAPISRKTKTHGNLSHCTSFLIEKEPFINWPFPSTNGVCA